eukprot:jgi/Chrzof1/9193/Cz03g39110.t1
MAKDTRSEKQKMLDGDLYYSFTPELAAERARARALLHKYNLGIPYDDTAARTQLLKELLGSMDESDPPYIEAPFYCDYGYNVHIGPGSYMNFGCTVLDCNVVKIGARVLFAPNVQLYAATHPLSGHVRQGTKGPELAKPITIGDDVWVGGGAIILPGVTIGEHAVIGAGSVVTKHVPPYTVVAGNPAKVLKELDRDPPPQPQETNS